MTTDLANALSKIIELCRKNPEGLSNNVLEAGTKNVTIEARKEAINVLLKKGQLIAFEQGGEVFFKEQSREEAARFKGLQSEDLLVYQAIQASKNDGIMTAHIKRETKLQTPQITKAIKNLDARQLIKLVPSTQKNRKIYMLFELQPSEKVTGGIWYSDREYDAGAIDMIKQQCLQYVLKQNVVTLDQVSNYLRKIGMTKDEMKSKYFKEIMDMLVLDGEIEELVSPGTGQFGSFAKGTVCYRASQSRVSGSFAFTNIPCGVCPVIHECSPHGIISPKTCAYYQEWLNF